MRPRPALGGALLAAVLLNALTRVSGSAWLALGSAAALALPFASLVLRPRLAAVDVTLLLPPRAVAGQLVEAELRVSGQAPVGTWVLDHPGLGRLEVALPGGPCRIAVTARATRRGVHRPGPAVLSSSAPFGLLRWSREVPAPVLVVHPQTGPTRVLPSEGAPVVAEHSLPVAGLGTEVLGLRPWRAGDPLRHISARATARHGRPVVLERERDTGPSLVVLAVGGGQGPAWEHAVSVLASRALAALQDGRPPVLLADNAPGRLDATGVLDFFAAVDEAGPLRAEDLRAALAAGGDLVLLAPPGAVENSGQVRRAAAAAGVRVEVLG